MNVVRMLNNRIDFERSDVSYWPEGSEKAGQVHSVYSIRLRRDLEPKFDIFRLADEHIAPRLIFTERLKSALDERGVSGAAYLH